jgi:hypothetical protein
VARVPSIILQTSAFRRISESEAVEEVEGSSLEQAGNMKPVASNIMVASNVVIVIFLFVRFIFRPS